MDDALPDRLRDVATRDRLSVVGVAKNCGKTTTLATLLSIRARTGRDAPGLVSVGVDGERRDALLGTKKPAISVGPDQWIATASGAVRRSSARVEYVDSLGVSTPLGDVYVCRVLEAGTVMLAGLGRRRSLRRAVDRLEARTGGAVWVDGAYDRITAAHPAVSPATVVATGAVADTDVSGVVDRTRALVSRLDLPETKRPRDRRLLERALDRERPVVAADGDIRPLPDLSAITGLEGLDDETDFDAIAIPGAVTDRVVETLASLGDSRLLIPDSTVLQLDDDQLWARFNGRREIRVLNGIDAVAVSYNPTSVDGDRMEGARLERGLRRAFPGRAIFDPLPYWTRWA